MTESPRWRLINAHYLNVRELPDGTRIEWEHKEGDRTTGKTIRKLYPVGCMLDPRDPQDCNYPGEIIVTHEANRTYPRDIVFVGNPTPDMEPLNDEAEAISASMRPRWEHPIDTLPVNGGMNSEESAFMAKMMQAFAGAAQTPNAVVPSNEVTELKERLAKLEAMIIAQNKAPAERRV